MIQVSGHAKEGKQLDNHRFAELILHSLLTGKFADHLPLFRRSVIYARDGLNLDLGLFSV